MNDADLAEANHLARLFGGRVFRNEDGHCVLTDETAYERVDTLTDVRAALDVWADLTFAHAHARRGGGRH